MYEPHNAFAAKDLVHGCVIKVQDEFVMVIDISDPTRQVRSEGIATITYSDADAITHREDQIQVSRHRPVMCYRWEM